MLVLKHHGREQGGEGAEQGECWPSSSCSVSNMVCYVSTSNMGLRASPPKASRWRWRMTLPPLGWRQMWRRRLCSRWRIRRRGILVPGKFHLAIHNFPHWGTNSPPSLFQLPLHSSSPNLVSCPPLLLPIQLYSLARCLLPTGPVVELVFPSLVRFPDCHESQSRSGNLTLYSQPGPHSE